MMAGQGIDRREISKALAIAAAASQFQGFSRWALAQTSTPRAKRYRPRFFNRGEYATIERLTELILPSDETPGAREAGVAEFIDFMVSSDAAIQSAFRKGLAWLDDRASGLFGATFSAGSEEQQTGLLRSLAYRAGYQEGEEQGRAFFELMRRYTVMGFYTTRIGLEQLDFPGFKTYSECPECTHTDDRAHTRLKK